MIALLKKYKEKIVLLYLIVVGFISFNYFFLSGQSLLYGDALSRLNISRKLIDNLTPGLAQLGNVWLPLPQLLMLPFIGSSFLWHSGIAGAIMSIAAFVVGGLYIYKSSQILTGSFSSSVLALSVYAFNINMLYLQTTALSESLFICTLSATIYYFLLWVKFGERMYLVPAALAVSAMTLTRYEGLAVLLSSIPMVYLYTYYKKRSHSNAEASTIMYTVLAGLGFGLWTIYLTIIFGDPLYWMNYYAAPKIANDGISTTTAFVFNLSFIEATFKYFTTVVWMNGLIPTILAIIAIPVLLYQSIRSKIYYFLPVLLSLSMFLFMIFSLQRNSPINQPELNIANILSPSTSKFPEFNIRYGMLMLPLIVLLCAVLLNIRFKVIKFFIVFLLFIQWFSYFYPKYTVIYQFPVFLEGQTLQGSPKQKAMTAWLKQNYDGGLIMISAMKNDPQMFQLGLDYKTYIHEGTGKYWKTSIKDPSVYATWVVFDSFNIDDEVPKFIKDSEILTLKYNKVFEEDGMLVFRIKEHPEMEIK